MAHSVRTSLPLPTAALRVWLAVHPNVALVAALLLLALLVRVIGLDRIEPNIQADEADRLQLLYRWLAGQPLGIFDVAPDGNPSAAYYPALLFLKLFGPSYVSLRLSSAFGSMLVVVVFFLLARRSLGFFASFGATTLLAFSGWPAVRPSLASSCAALASASLTCASLSVAETRTSSAPAPTSLPRSTGVAITRPPVSAATSA